MNTQEPTLSSRLRAAAMERTRTTSAQVADVVLDPDGVIDLRRLEEADDTRSIASPPEALRATRGRLGDAGDVDHLYDDTAPTRRRWPWRGRQAAAEAPVRTAPPRTLPSSSARPSVPLPRAASPTAPTTPSGVVAARPVVEPVPAPIDPPAPDEDPAVEIDLRDDDRPVARCPKCGGNGRRDLLDRVSATAYFSCDDCLHMWQRHEEL